MAQTIRQSKTETQLRELQDKLYQHSKGSTTQAGGQRSRDFWKSCQQKQPLSQQFTTSKAITAVRLGVIDFKTMRKDYLERPYQWVIQDIQNAFKHL